MARCDEGYVCDVCGEAVDKMTQSSLYVRYIIGEVTSRQLLSAQERHLECDPILAQYIETDGFPRIVCEGPFDKHFLDHEFVEDREELVTRGWLRLREVLKSKLPISEYPLDEFRGHEEG